MCLVFSKSSKPPSWSWVADLFDPPGECLASSTVTFASPDRDRAALWCCNVHTARKAWQRMPRGVGRIKCIYTAVCHSSSWHIDLIWFNIIYYVYMCVCVCIHMSTEYFDYKFYIPLLFHVLSCRVPLLFAAAKVCQSRWNRCKGGGVLWFNVVPSCHSGTVTSRLAESSNILMVSPYFGP